MNLAGNKNKNAKSSKPRKPAVTDSRQPAQETNTVEAPRESVKKRGKLLNFNKKSQKTKQAKQSADEIIAASLEPAVPESAASAEPAVPESAEPLVIPAFESGLVCEGLASATYASWRSDAELELFAARLAYQVSRGECFVGDITEHASFIKGGGAILL